MYDWDDNFYEEPSEFEIKMDELKESLMSSVKESYKTEMDRLRKENAELQVVKRDLEQIKSEYRTKEQQLKYEKDNLLNTVRRERLSTLMKDFEVITYRAASDRVLPEKCSKCDKYRRFHFKTPSGRDSYEDCSCSVGKVVYAPQENICSSFGIDRDGRKLEMWYKFEHSGSEEYSELSSSNYAKKIYSDEMKYEDIEKYSTYFHSKEDCQKYCDWLNAKVTT